MLGSHPTPRQSPDREQRCINRSPRSLVLPSPALYSGESVHPWVPHQHQSNPFPQTISQWTFTPTPELVPSPAPLQHPQPLIPCGRGWCPPGCCCRQGKSHEGRVRDAATAISSELNVSLLRLSHLPADNLHTEFVFLGFVFSTSLLFSSMNSALPLVFYLSWQNCFSS